MRLFNKKPSAANSNKETASSPNGPVSTASAKKNGAAVSPSYILQNSLKSLLAGWRANRRKIIQLTLAVIALGLLFSIIQLVRTRNIYAVIDNRKITKQQYAAARKAYTSFDQKVTNKPGDFKDVDAHTRDQLILDASLQAAGEKTGVKVTQDDIDNSLFVVSLKGGKVAQGRTGYKKELGWSDEDINRDGRIKVLENKLSNHLLQYTNLLHVDTYFSRVDDEPIAKQTLEASAQPWFSAHKTIYEILAASDDASAQAGSYSPTQILATNRTIASLSELGESERAAVAKLKNAGDYTPVTRGDGSLYFIDRLEAKSSGSYKDWDDFTKAAVSRAIVMKGAFDMHRLTFGFN
ncbi:MAG TPA: hypothetical protein VLE74_01555 [Candidatus Saccharimonadales bacterium]|nr:hypothetical protein [Candidatus Saccharimonadales bacterium]